MLRSGEKSLARSAAVQLEVALLPYNSGAPLFHEVVAYMAEYDLLVTEVSGFDRVRIWSRSTSSSRGAIPPCGPASLPSEPFRADRTAAGQCLPGSGVRFSIVLTFITFIP